MRALISCYDKTGIEDFCRELSLLGWDLISTGGTYDVLKKVGISVTEVSDLTGFPEMLDGRVKTLHPKIHGGILYRRDLEDDKQAVKAHGIEPIDMIVNNLYPFEDTWNQGASHSEIIEKIDIGGPSMLRAAAKNYRFVSVVIDVSDYPLILSELKENGRVSEKTNRYLARKVFNFTAYYDAVISDYFNQIEGVDYPDFYTVGLKNRTELRYGENPHQSAAFYSTPKDTKGTLSSAVKLNGKPLSFNNINDANGALEALKSFDEPCCVAVKHSNPCGIAIANELYEAYRGAYDCDSVSIFGGIIAFNREVDERTANEFKEVFLEVVIAPSFSEGALEILRTKKNLRLLAIESIGEDKYRSKDMKKVLGGMLIQDRDVELYTKELRVVTKRAPSERELSDLKFAWKCAKAVKSNGVVIAKENATIGIGLGEVNRVWAVREAIERAGEKVKGSVIASDAFFPFKDSLEALASAGVSAVIQPGGSVRDEESIRVADDNGMAMIFTDTRHFRH